MLRPLLCALLLIQTLAHGSSDPSVRATIGLKTGVNLRLHVVAQDDTDAMQALKLAVRDDVRTAFAQQARNPADTMLVQAEKLMPELTRAAKDSAILHDFHQPVTVQLGFFDFERHETDGLVFPAGRYPALMIRLGDAQGHNWWGLLDPAAALDAVCIPGGSDVFHWDWSWDGFLSALLHLPLKAGESVG